MFVMVRCYFSFDQSPPTRIKSPLGDLSDSPAASQPAPEPVNDDESPAEGAEPKTEDSGSAGKNKRY